MTDSYTEGALRALARAEARARRRGAVTIEPADLLAALVDEPEGRAAVLLAEHGLHPAEALEALAIEPWSGAEAEFRPDEPMPRSVELRAVLGDAAQHARGLDRARPIGTESLLAGLLSAAGPIPVTLAASGLAVADLTVRLEAPTRSEAAPLPPDLDMPPLELAGPTEAVDLARILDAAANRAREGLRVVEDYARFALNDASLTKRLKEVRHRLAEATRGLPLEELIASRDTPGDVGTHITTPTERVRENPRAVLAANLRRTGEALRSLEEYAKLTDPWLSARFEVLRYDVYTLEKLVLTAVAAYETLGDARLCVLVGGLSTLGDLRWVVEEALAGGAQVIQLREKGLPDREVLRRAREVRLAAYRAGARFILNDRPDLARLAGADGVHLGQDDQAPRDARRIVGPRALLGVSTHDREQIERAALDGAAYLGVGPVFPSETKAFADLAGLAFVRTAAETASLPWFAIGGITPENLDDVLAAGAERIAVSAAVVHAPSPREAAAELRTRLDAMN
jgi:thiamine-phosphate pyrophosphorylase